MERGGREGESAASYMYILYYFMIAFPITAIAFNQLSTGERERERERERGRERDSIHTFTPPTPHHNGSQSEAALASSRCPL